MMMMMKEVTTPWVEQPSVEPVFFWRSPSRLWCRWVSVLSPRLSPRWPARQRSGQEPSVCSPVGRPSIRQRIQPAGNCDNVEGGALLSATQLHCPVCRCRVDYGKSARRHLDDRCHGNRVQWTAGPGTVGLRPHTWSRCDVAPSHGTPQQDAFWPAWMTFPGAPARNHFRSRGFRSHPACRNTSLWWSIKAENSSVCTNDIDASIWQMTIVMLLPCRPNFENSRSKYQPRQVI